MQTASAVESYHDSRSQKEKIRGKEESGEEKEEEMGGVKESVGYPLLKIIVTIGAYSHKSLWTVKMNQ